MSQTKAQLFDVSVEGPTALKNGAFDVTLGAGGNVTISDGNLVLASGSGIDFSATANGSGTVTSELLDDYEEGTFTLTVDSGTVSGPGIYIKVGNYVQCLATASSFSDRTSASAITFSGLPFLPNSNQAGGSVFGRYLTQPAGGVWSSTYVTSFNTAFIYAMTNGNFTELYYDDLAALSSSIYLRFGYTTA